MKYLIINGSPHKGNTWKLVEIAMETLLKHDSGAKFQQIHLAELQLPFCTGCSNCFRLGHEKCPHYEKISAIISSMEKADGIIFASTTFNMRETTLLKNLFDHFCFMMHRPHFFKSKALVLTTTGGVGGRSSAKSIASSLKGIGFNRCYLFSTSSFSWNDYVPKIKTINSLSKLTVKFYKDIISKKLHSPSVMLLIPYNLFRGMSLAYVKGSMFETKDGWHWTQDIRKNKVYDSEIPVPFYKKPIGHLFYFIGKKAGKLKSMQVTYKK